MIDYLGLESDEERRAFFGDHSRILDEHKPLPTCNKDNEDILRYKVLPLTRARDFLKIITSFAGLIEPFRNPDSFPLLYFDSETPIQRECNCGYRTRARRRGQWTWECRTSWTRGIDAIYHSFRSQGAYDTSLLHPRQRKIDTFFLLYEIGCAHRWCRTFSTWSGNWRRNWSPKATDPVSNDSNNLDSLRKHHRSILEHISTID